MNIEDRHPYYYVSKDSKCITSGCFGEESKYIEKEDNIVDEQEDVDVTENVVGLDRKSQKAIVFDSWMNIYYTVFPYYKNHHIDELKLSVRIAKKNVSFDSGNKYYKNELNRIENNLKNLLTTSYIK